MYKIIIVEDDPLIAEIYEKKFSGAGFEVQVASSGKQVLSLAKREKIDLILLDLVMSEMSGMETLEKLKSGKYSEEMKVIIFSNLSDRENQDKAIKMGADGFILKTEYSPSDLVKEIERILNESKERKKNEENMNNEKTGNGNKKNKGKILLIEDEDIFIDLFGKKLKDSGYEVEAAKNGAWGLKEAMDKDFDLIVMDMLMPSMNGKEMIEKLKDEEKTKNIPVIVLSASSSDEELKEMKKKGAVDYFSKTQIVPSDLTRKIDEILKK